MNLGNSLKWEICKHEIKEMSIKFSKQTSRRKHNRLQKLEKQLKKATKTKKATFDIIDTRISFYKSNNHLLPRKP